MRGFGITLSIGVVVSMFAALVVTRAMVETLVRRDWALSRPGPLGLRVGHRLRGWLTERGPNILGRRRLWFAISAAVLAIAVAGIVGRGFRYGLEFEGGRILEYDTSRWADLDDVRRELAERGLPRAIVQASGDGNVAIRTSRLTPDQEAAVVAAVEAAGGDATEVRDEFVGPTIGSELRRRAVMALGLALAAQLVFLAVRFRWTFGAAAVVAMFHDVTILLGVFAWLGKELDGVFLAALLTVIGYSINDSVVVFDRIREQRRDRSREPLAVVANEACLDTIPRTVNTGVGALAILTALYFLGGDTLTDFAFALIIGIVVGTYSSVFTAAPLAVAFAREPAAAEAGGLRILRPGQGADQPPPDKAEPWRWIASTTKSGPPQAAPPSSTPPRPRKKSGKKKGRR